MYAPVTYYLSLDPREFTEQNRILISPPAECPSILERGTQPPDCSWWADWHLSSLYECVITSVNITGVVKRFERSVDWKYIVKMQVTIHVCTLELHVSQQCGWSWNVLFLAPTWVSARRVFIFNHWKLISCSFFSGQSAKPHDFGRSVWF